MGCNEQEYLANFTSMVMEHVSNKTTPHQQFRFYVANVAIPIVCAFGILGNILNLIVLAQKQLVSSMDRLEKSAHLGLVALAVSDMLFCMLALTTGVWRKPLIIVGKSSYVPALFHTHKLTLLNTLLFSSTWLTVVMAMGRYLAICHPLHTSSFIHLRGTRVAIAVVFVASILINLPKFLEYELVHMKCPPLTPGVDCKDCYRPAQRKMFSGKHYKEGHTITWALLGTFLPLLILLVCNVCLILALRRSQRIQRLYRANQPRDSGHRITPTLITIIILFIILVCPSEILKFCYAIGKVKSNKQGNAYITAINVTNLMVATNFAINFILYCAINVHFRNTIANLFCCRWYRQRRLDYRNSQHTYTYNLSEAETETHFINQN